MATLEARYRVQDRDAFMDAFAAFRPVRMELGVKSCRVLGGDEDPADIVVMFELPDCDAARTYAADPRRQEALKKAGVKHTILRYDADHAFANPSGGRYDEKAAEDAWGKVRRFFEEQLKK